MSTDTDLKIIEHTEGRARNMLRLCELARIGLLHTQPMSIETNALLDVMEYARKRFLDEDGKPVPPTSTMHTLSTQHLFNECAAKWPQLREWTHQLDMMESILERAPGIERVPNAMGLWRYRTSRQSPGGKARAEKLTPERRSAISKTAANTRWGKSHKGG